MRRGGRLGEHNARARARAPVPLAHLTIMRTRQDGGHAPLRSRGRGHAPAGSRGRGRGWGRGADEGECGHRRAVRRQLAQWLARHKVPHDDQVVRGRAARHAAANIRCTPHVGDLDRTGPGELHNLDRVDRVHVAAVASPQLVHGAQGWAIPIEAHDAKRGARAWLPVVARLARSTHEHLSAPVEREHLPRGVEPLSNLEVVIANEVAHAHGAVVQPNRERVAFPIDLHAAHEGRELDE